MQISRCAGYVSTHACVDRCIMFIIIASCVISLGIEVEAFRKARKRERILH